MGHMKLEDDPTYQRLQRLLEDQRNERDWAEQKIAQTLKHINAIKRDFKIYEEECNVEETET